MENIDTRVAISMAVLAGLLAVVSLFGNQASGNMITAQARANNLQAQANMSRTKATDTWSYFQAKTLRKHLYKISANILLSLNVKTDLQKTWTNTALRYTSEASELKTQASDLDKHASELQRKANITLGLSIQENKKADTLDLARLCAEIGLVLCSIALVSKRRMLWFMGMIIGLGSLSIFSFQMLFM